MSLPRSLPARPNLEYEQKEAKAFLRLLKAGDAGAFARAVTVHPAIARTADGEVKLADAQLVLAREYGFASWPRMVRYFGDVERQSLAIRNPKTGGMTRHEGMVQALLAAHRSRRIGLTRALAAYVPRFYGRSVNEVLDAHVTEADARQAAARMAGCATWEALVATPTTELPVGPDHRVVGPIRAAIDAIGAQDLVELQRLVAAHPELLHQRADGVPGGSSLLRATIGHERRLGREAMAPIMAWLLAQGLDLQETLDLELAGHMGMTGEEVRFLLDRGADPNWVSPSGVPMLEYALLRWWNGAAVDLLARRAKPRPALWIAAGLGDLDGVRRALDARGKPLSEAAQLRPDFDATGGPPIPRLPEPEDEELLMEAAFVAMINGRATVVEYLLSRDFPADSRVYGNTLLSVAVGNGFADVTEVLLKGGADLDSLTGDSNGTPPEMGRSFFRPNDPARRRVAELCGWDPDALLAGMPKDS